MRPSSRSHAASFLLVALVLLALSGGLVSSARADLMVVGNDQEVVFDAEGNRQTSRASARAGRASRPALEPINQFKPQGSDEPEQIFAERDPLPTSIQ